MNFFAVALLALVFLSKISLAGFGVPASIPPVIFQHGLHPYANVALNLIFGIFVLVKAFSAKKLAPQSRIFVTAMVVVAFLLIIQSILQILFIPEVPTMYLLATLFCTLWMFLIFALVLPRLMDPYQTIRFISTWSLNLVVLSLLLLIVRPDLAYKGGRFIGVFKHIPFMVSVGMLGVIFTLPRFQFEKNLFKRAWFVTGILLSFLVLLLTGTRSATAASLMAVLLWALRAPAANPGFRYLKYSFGLIVVSVGVLFGAQILSYAEDLATGKAGLFQRQAQDGVSSRLDEISRGWENFQRSPWIGQGLLEKFSAQDGELQVNSYDSFKDPHNIFVSAGVVAGWPFVIWTGVFLLLIAVLSARQLFSENPFQQVFAIYCIVNLPILIIYHWHLSLGGMADRIYWLMFGFIALAGVGSGGKKWNTEDSARPV